MKGFKATCYLCRELGDNFKWILYGDDDTYFFVDAVMKNLQKLDPATPYFLTGKAGKISYELLPIGD